ncbi:integrase, catalytic region, zinc finger, CCHC-type containing protein [Tanacetum coccineum]
MTKKDDEKTTFHMEKGVFCYKKMHFGLKNAGAIYQRLVDSAFKEQIWVNLEAYVGDMEGKFLGYIVTSEGIRANPKKTKAVMDMPSLSTLKQLQYLSGKLASLNHLKLVSELPTLTTPKKGETLMMYLAAANKAVSMMLLTERDGRQMPIHYVSRSLQAAETNYAPMETGPSSRDQTVKEVFPSSLDQVRALDKLEAKCHENLETTAAVKHRRCKGTIRAMIPATIITDNETQFVNDPFKKWVEKLKIQLISTSVYHPQGNEAVERASPKLRHAERTKINSSYKGGQLPDQKSKFSKYTHSSHASGSGADEGTGDIPGVPDVLTYGSDDEQISWKSSEEDDEDEVNVNEKDDDNDNNDDEEVHGVNIEDETMNEVANNEEDEGNELYRDLNVNLEGIETMMTDAPLPNVQATQETKDTHVILIAPINPKGQQQSSSVSFGFMSNMLNPRPDTGIDSIFNTEATSLVDVLVTNIVEPPLVFATTLPSPPTLLLTHMQQTPVPTPTIGPSFSLLRDEAQAENKDFLNKLDGNIKKIIKDQVKEQVKAQVSKILSKIMKTVNEQLKAEVMTRSSTESKTSLAIAANLSELELKKILIEKMESNKYKDDEDKDEEPSAGSNQGSKRRRARKEPESTSAPKEKTSKTTSKSTDGSKSQHKSAA